MLHPSQYFTEAEVKRLNDYIQAHLREREKRLEAKRPAKPLEPITYRDCYEARDARAAFELQPDAEKNLRTCTKHKTKRSS